MLLPVDVGNGAAMLFVREGDDVGTEEGDLAVFVANIGLSWVNLDGSVLLCLSFLSCPFPFSGGSGLVQCHSLRAVPLSEGSISHCQ